MDGFKEILGEILYKNGLSEFVVTDVADRFCSLADEVVSVNEHMNLTAITDPLGVAVRHIADSLTVAAELPVGARVVDIGCGAGFPSLPLAIARPDLSVTALDATAKRIAFVSDTAKKLGLTNLTAVACRAEAAADMHGTFDAAVSRAVARLNILSELCLPFVKAGGVFVAMKGDGAAEEVAEAKTGIAFLGGCEPENKEFFLLGEEAPQRRALVKIKKIGKTPSGYPREFSKIKKKPL